MSRKPKRIFSYEVKKKAVDDFVAGRRSAAEIAAELSLGPNMVYRWRAELDSKARGEKISSLESQGIDPKLAKRILEQEDELALYKAKVAELALHVDLLKKLQGIPSSQSASELSGLINTMKASARKRKPVS